MVAQRQLHTFVVRHTPPEGDLLSHEDRDGMQHEEAAFVLACFEAGIANMHAKLRRKLQRVLQGMFPEDRFLESDTRIDGDVVELKVVCALSEGDDRVVSLIHELSDVLPRTWESVANRE